MKSSAENLVKFSYRKFGLLILAPWLAGILLTTSGCSTQGQQAMPPAPPPALVTVAEAVAKDVPVYLDEIGKNYASESVTITPQVAGKITERNFVDGDDLKKDQILFKIDPRPFQAQLDLAVAQLAQSKSALDLANIQLKMYASLPDPRAVSQVDYETKKNAVDANQALVQASEAAVEAAKLNLDYCIIRSPIDGRAGARLVDTGNIVQANTTALLSIDRLDPIYADFTVTERDLPNVRRQMSRGESRAMVRIPSDAENAARAAKLTFLDNAVQAGTGTIFMRATLPNADRHFWPGQFVDVKLVLSTIKAAVLVPNEATQISQKGPFVYVVKPDNTVELRLVTLGQRQGENVVLASGVVPGENVVVTGQLTIGPGAKVRIGGAPGAAPGAAQGGRQ
jgi:membrane fusion protein, multidrug efflux system